MSSTSAHPCGEFQVVTPDLLDRESARLLPCPFCGRHAALLLHGSRIVAAHPTGSFPCRIKPKVVSRVRVIFGMPTRSWPRGAPQCWQQTFDDLVNAWNTRAPATSGALTP